MSNRISPPPKLTKKEEDELVDNVIRLTTDLASLQLVGRKDHRLVRFLQDRHVNLPMVNYRPTLGLVRRQWNHKICWIYAALDVLTWWLVNTGQLLEFHPISARHVAIVCDVRKRNLVEEKHFRSKKKKPLRHLCFGNPSSALFKFAKNHQIRLEDSSDLDGFSCLDQGVYQHFPTSFPRLVYRVQLHPSIDDIIHQLQFGPIVAAVRIFQPEYSELGVLQTDVYRGPTSSKSLEGNLHGVVISEVRYVGDDLVAICKSSHGAHRHDGGYVSVCLRTMYGRFYQLEPGQQLCSRLIQKITYIVSV